MGTTSLHCVLRTLRLSITCPHIENLLILASARAHPLRSYLQHPKLTEINLRDCALVTDTGIRRLREGCPSLASVDVFGCTEVTDHALAVLIEECKDLRPENLQSTSKGDLYCEAVAQRFEDLTSINLCKSVLVTDKGLSNLMERFPGLTEVNLDGCSQVGFYLFFLHTHTHTHTRHSCASFSYQTVTHIRLPK